MAASFSGRDAGKAKAKPVETTSAMPDGSDKSEYMSTGPEQPVAEAETPATAAVEQSQAPEEKVKDETKATIRNIPRDAPAEEGKCIKCGSRSERRVIFARAY